jgi:hypothetical protein
MASGSPEVCLPKRKEKLENQTMAHGEGESQVSKSRLATIEMYH